MEQESESKVSNDPAENNDLQNDSSNVLKGNDESDKYLMWASMSFAVMLLVVGVPLWWKTTEVERSPLPYPAIAALDPSHLSIATKIYIYTEYPTLYNSLYSSFNQHLRENQSVLGVVITSVKLDSFLDSDVSLESVEAGAKKGKIATEPGSLLLVQIPASDLNDQHNILISSYRIVYFTKETNETELLHCVMDWILESEQLTTKMSSMLNPQTAIDEERKEKISTRLRAATSYDFIFSIVISDPGRINLSLDMKQLIAKYVDPLLIQLKEVASHRAKSQWIHLLDLSAFSTNEISGSSSIISLDSLPHIITPLEKRLGSGVCGVAGCVQLVLYVTPCNSTPLVFGTDESLSMTTPPWGSVQILNPESCGNGSNFHPKPAPIMAVFISQIHSLLGFTNPPESLSHVKLLKKLGPELRDWQLDSLYRMRALEQLTSASLTLKSLAKLLGEISNIVINSEVARCVRESVQNVEEGLSIIRSGNLINALRSSQRAFIHSEKAFTNPSLLALLYFPDDQKYAVYIPLFLPIMIPVFMSLKSIYNYLLGKRIKAPESSS